MAQQYHPDSHELDDWAIYGPKNPEISTLVEHLARRHGLRLQEIETLLLRTLKDRISQEEAQQPT